MTNALAGSMWSEMDFDAPLEDHSGSLNGFNTPLAGAPDYSELTMFSLRNKNKSKNFRKNLKMQVPAGPKRIVFADEVGATSQAQAGSSKDGGVAASETGAATSNDGAASSKTQTTRHQARLPRLVPPSERTDLPPNVFVTSVDVEAGWEADTLGYQYDTSAYEQSYAAEAEADEANIQLSYDDEPSADATTNASTTAQPSPYPALAQSYASATRSQPLASLAQLEVGKHVGWTSLELNAATMTPEVMVVIANVVALEGGDGGTEDNTKQTVTVKRIPKPLEGEAHELLLNVAGEGDGEEEEQEEETFTLKEAVDAGWRVIQ